jgi:hypothetical protein
VAEHGAQVSLPRLHDLIKRWRFRGYRHEQILTKPRYGRRTCQPNRLTHGGNRVTLEMVEVVVRASLRVYQHRCHSLRSQDWSGHDFGLPAINKSWLAQPRDTILMGSSSSPCDDVRKGDWIRVVSESLTLNSLASCVLHLAVAVAFTTVYEFA